MLQNSWDSYELPDLNLPYNRIERELSEKSRLVRGENLYVTTGGKMARRPGTLEISNSTNTQRCDRLWIYQTLETPPNVYIIGSFYDTATETWNLQYLRLADTVPAWTSLGAYRDLDASTQPHNLVVARGLAFVKTYPDSGSSEKLGTVQLDGTGGTIDVHPWGLLGPQTPAAIVGAVTILDGSLDAITTTVVVADDTDFPATPFIIQVEYEQMEVTAGVPGLSWTVTRGANGTTPAAHDDLSIVLWRDWSDSDHMIVVNSFWRYSYAYKTITGQISNRAAIQTNPSKLPSLTGPFINQIPKITVQGHSDTTNIPTIVIYRSTDGGGTYFQLHEIDNTGAGDIEFEDKYLESGVSGGTFNDPVPDADLETGQVGPTLTSNSPPPACLAPDVTGVDAPQPTSPMAYYAARIWFGIGNILFFSGNEEIIEGIPEECFPSGTFGNFFRFQYPIVNVVATTNALYVFTLQATYQISGTNLETFNARQVFDNIGAPYGHPRALTSFGSTVAVLTNDFRVVLINDNEYRSISDPLFTDLVNAIDAGSEIEIRYWADLDKEWIVVSGHRNSDTTYSRQWVYDIRKSQQVKDDFWFLPWTVRSTACLSASIDEETSQRRLCWFVWDTTEVEGQLVYLDPTGVACTDWFLDAEETYDWYADFNLMRVPAGNHVNTLSRPAITPDFYCFYIERSLFAGDSDPDFFYYKDDFWSQPIPAFTTEEPPRRNPSLAYKTILMPVNEACQRAAIRLRKLETAERFELQSLTYSWSPTSGA